MKAFIFKLNFFDDPPNKMKRQKTLLNFFSKSQNKDNDLGDFCTPDPQKKCTVTEEPMVAIKERKKTESCSAWEQKLPPW